MLILSESNCFYARRASSDNITSSRGCLSSTENRLTQRHEMLWHKLEFMWQLQSRCDSIDCTVLIRAAECDGHTDGQTDRRTDA